MKENKTIKILILLYWTFFWGLSVVDKIIPDVHLFWVGKDFFALFIKFFSSLGLKNPVFATVGLAFISALEVINFIFYGIALGTFIQGRKKQSEIWFFRAVVSSMILFSLFSIADQVFGDRFQLLEHGLFWMVLLASWFIFKHFSTITSEYSNLRFSKSFKIVLALGFILTLFTSILIFKFSDNTFANVNKPVRGEEVIQDVYKFDFPFLADKDVWEKTINTFKKEHPELKVNYIYTGPSELNTKKKTHMLLYVFTEKI